MKHVFNKNGYLVELRLKNTESKTSFREYPTLTVLIQKKAPMNVLILTCTLTTRKDLLAFLNFLNEQHSFYDNASKIIDMKLLIHLTNKGEPIINDNDWYISLLDFSIIDGKELWLELYKVGFHEFLPNNKIK